VDGVVLVLIPLSGDVREALVHGHMGHHVLVVGDAVAVSDIGRCPVSKRSVADTGAAEVEKTDRANAGLLEVHSGECGHGGTWNCGHNTEKSTL
jgi:hypothetical protein